MTDTLDKAPRVSVATMIRGGTFGDCLIDAALVPPISLAINNTIITLMIMWSANTFLYIFYPKPNYRTLP